MITALTLFCSFSFFGYGLSCLLSKHMVLEFERYGLARFRAMTGFLQVLAATGLLIGVVISWLGALAAAGLCLQMACGIIVRIQIGDTWYQCLPATFYLFACGIITICLL